MDNTRGTGQRLTVTAADAAGTTAGVPIIEDGFHGFPVNTVSQNERYALDISGKEFEVSETLVETAKPEGGFKKGEDVYINENPAAEGHVAFRLQIVAHKAAAPASSVLFARVSGSSADGADPNNIVPSAGNLMLLHLSPAS